jgi:hypothetical protein
VPKDAKEPVRLDRVLIRTELFAVIGIMMSAVMALDEYEDDDAGLLEDLGTWVDDADDALGAVQGVLTGGPPAPAGTPEPADGPAPS